jgi:hypothetical protein
MTGAAGAVLVTERRARGLLTPLVAWLGSTAILLFILVPAAGQNPFTALAFLSLR